MIGARQGLPGPIHRLIARATAANLRAFVVPGMDVARAHGLDLDGVGLPPVDNPRRANVLVLLAPVPDALIDPAVVAWAQMPRPRAILAIGDVTIPDLPEPDIRVDPDENAVCGGVDQLRDVFATGAWQPEVTPFQHHALAAADEDESESMSHQHHHGGGDDGEGQGHEGHDDGDHESSAAGEHDSQEEYADHDPGGEHHDHSGHDEHQDHGEHSTHEGDQGHDGHEGHGGHSHHMDHGGGFMSMIAMTRDLPRSPDELQMDWLEIPFGPLHPGLPAGLNLALTLDGDRIASAQVNDGVTRDHLGLDLPVQINRFRSELDQIDRLAPGVYGVLAESALAAHGRGGREIHQIAAVEQARVRSHLNWLVSFAHLLGFGWLAERSARLLRRDIDALSASELDSIDRACRSYLMRRRLTRVGQLDSDAHQNATGPIARAMGLANDARLDDPAYQALGFEPVLRDEGDAYARLLVRLDEIRQSLELIEQTARLDALPQAESARAGIETPRGRATLDVSLDGDLLTDLRLETPSSRHLALIPAVCQRHELGAGLLAIASLDISPWELEP